MSDLLMTPVWIARRRVREARYALKGQRQRFTKGYADAEAWNLDSWLCEALGARLKYLAEHHHGYPGVLTYEKDDGSWGRDLNRHADALLAYPLADETRDTAEAMRIINEAKEALRWVAEWLPHLWD